MQAELSLVVQRAEGLAAMDRSGKSDPYVIVRVGGQEVERTSVQPETLNPTWDESFVIKPANEQIVLEVYDKDRSFDDFLGLLRLGTVMDILSAHGDAIKGEEHVIMHENLKPRPGHEKLDEQVRGALFLGLKLTKAPDKTAQEAQAAGAVEPKAGMHGDAGDRLVLEAHALVEIDCGGEWQTVSLLRSETAMPPPDM